MERRQESEGGTFSSHFLFLPVPSFPLPLLFPSLSIFYITGREGERERERETERDVEGAGGGRDAH